jgi:prevent-host-death family protein
VASAELRVQISDAADSADCIVTHLWYKLYKMCYYMFNTDLLNKPMPTKLTASLARQNFSDILSRAEYRGERVIVHRGKKAVAAVVPIEDL